jgi:hypothetical protein
MAPQSARRDRKNQRFPPCYSSTQLGDLDPVRELPYGLAALVIAASEAGQMAASDQVSNQPKNRLRSGGRPQTESGH